jgi:hypothetical protein
MPTLTIAIKASPLVGYSDNGILVEEWRYDMQPYWDTTGKLLGSSPAIADLGPDVNGFGTDSNKDLEIVMGSDELWAPSGIFRDLALFRF